MPFEVDVEREISRLDSRIRSLETKFEELAKSVDGIKQARSRDRMHGFTYLDFESLDRYVRYQLEIRLRIAEANAMLAMAR